MSKALVELKKAAIHKELATAKKNAEEDAKWKEAKLRAEPMYTQVDIDDITTNWTIITTG